MSNRLPVLLFASLSAFSFAGLGGCAAGEPEPTGGASPGASPSPSSPSSPLSPSEPTAEQVELQKALLAEASDLVGAPACLDDRSCERGASCDRSELDCVMLKAPGTMPGGKMGENPVLELCVGKCRFHLPPRGPELGEPCGNHFCAVGQVCCNASCGLCITPGGLCLKEVCGIAPPPAGEKCGHRFCGEGQYCCNTSCGICAPIEGTCPQIFCETPLLWPRALDSRTGSSRRDCLRRPFLRDGSRAARPYAERPGPGRGRSTPERAHHGGTACAGPFFATVHEPPVRTLSARGPVLW